jgi:hypothetical protein
LETETHLLQSGWKPESEKVRGWKRRGTTMDVDKYIAIEEEHNEDQIYPGIRKSEGYSVRYLLLKVVKALEKVQKSRV